MSGKDEGASVAATVAAPVQRIEIVGENPPDPNEGERTIGNVARALLGAL